MSRLRRILAVPVVLEARPVRVCREDRARPLEQGGWSTLEACVGRCRCWSCCSRSSRSPGSSVRPTWGKEPATRSTARRPAPASALPPPCYRCPGPRRTSAGRPGARSAPPRPTWVSRLARSASPPPPRFRFHGTVRDEGGQLLYRATVYQLSHEVSHGTGWVRERAETNDRGEFSFLGHPPAGTWICARHPGHRIVFHEGADVGRDGAVHLVLEEAPPLVVRLLDAEGEPVGFGAVRAVPVTRRGAAVAYPGPESRVPEQLEMTGSDGTATFRFGIRVPVVVLPEVEGMLTRPGELRVPDAEGSFTFELVSAGGLELKAVDESGAPVAESLWVSVLDPHTGEELASYRSSERDGALEVEPTLPPGPYHLDVSARGYEPVVVPGLVLPVGPAIVRHTVRLEPLGAGATLRILLPRLPAEPAGARRRSDPTVFVRRGDRGWDAVGWVHRADPRWDAGRSSVTLDLRPGTYEVVLCRPQDGSVAALGPLVLGAGQEVEKRAACAAGVCFALYDALPPDLAVRALRVVVPGRGPFPPVGSWFSTAIRDAAGLVETIDAPGSQARRTAGGGALLGPYPGAHVVLEVDDWSGRTHRFTVGG